MEGLKAKFFQSKGSLVYALINRKDSPRGLHSKRTYYKIPNRYLNIITIKYKMMVPGSIREPIRIITMLGPERSTEIISSLVSDRAALSKRNIYVILDLLGATFYKVKICEINSSNVFHLTKYI